jgi:serine/threonine protein kinase
LQAGIGSDEEAAQDSTPDALGGGTRFGVYEIDCHADGSFCELGRGAMGVTYRATDTSLQRKVALKIIKTDIAERSADARERFVREARAAAALRHEHIATIYHRDAPRDRPTFYAMELMEGEIPDERVHRAGPLDARMIIGAQQVTSAWPQRKSRLSAPRFKTGKPDARLVRWRKTTSTIQLLVKIIDFGLAKLFTLQPIRSR